MGIQIRRVSKLWHLSPALKHLTIPLAPAHHEIHDSLQKSLALSDGTEQTDIQVQEHQEQEPAPRQFDRKKTPLWQRLASCLQRSSKKRKKNEQKVPCLHQQRPAAPKMQRGQSNQKQWLQNAYSTAMLQNQSSGKCCRSSNASWHHPSSAKTTHAKIQTSSSPPHPPTATQDQP